MFAAIILIGFVFAIVSNKSKFNSAKTMNIKNYLTNYKYEAKIIIDNAVFENKNISIELRNFTEDFIEYGESKNLDVDTLYMYTHENNLFIVNYMPQSVKIISTDEIIEPLHELSTSYSEEIRIKYRNESYTFEFNDPIEIEFKTLFIIGDPN